MCIFSKENKIILTLNIDHSDIGEKIYFLQNYSEMEWSFEKDIEKNKLNINNFIIFINDKIYESKEYFVPETVGIYDIKIYANALLKIVLDFFIIAKIF